MDRIIQADKAFLKWCEKTSKNVVHIADAWYAAVEWADEHPINYDGKAMLHVLNKGAAIGRREMLDKACEWLNENLPWSSKPPRQIIEEFKQAMEEQ